MQDQESFNLYLREVQKLPLIDREEEKRLVALAQAGDKEARNRLVQSHLRFVISIAKKYQNTKIPLEDLVSEGNIGLMHAIDHFEVKRGYHFISYAVWWIRQAILKSIQDQARPIRLPANRNNQILQIEKTTKEIEQETGETPKFDEVVSILRYSLSDMQEIYNLAKETVSLDRRISEDNPHSLEDLIHNNELSPEEQAIFSNLKRDVRSALNILTKKESKILSLRFGLSGQEPLSLSKIAAIYGITKERVRQIEKSALRTLLNSPRTRHLEVYTAS